MRAAVKSVTCGFHFVNEWHDKIKKHGQSDRKGSRSVLSNCIKQMLAMDFWAPTSLTPIESYKENTLLQISSHKVQSKKALIYSDNCFGCLQTKR